MDGEDVGNGEGAAPAGGATGVPRRAVEVAREGSSEPTEWPDGWSPKGRRRTSTGKRTRAELVLARAEVRMARSFRAWLRARAAVVYYRSVERRGDKVTLPAWPHGEDPGVVEVGSDDAGGLLWTPAKI